MDIITKEQFEEYKKILNLHDDLSIDCIIEHYKIELANWSISNFISECDLKSMIDAFKFFCGIDKNEETDSVEFIKSLFRILDNQREYGGCIPNIDLVTNFYMLGCIISKKISLFKFDKNEKKRFDSILCQLFKTIQFIEEHYEKGNVKIKTKKSEKKP